MSVLYRLNVAGILQDAKGKILVGERLKNRHSWQFPQGGVDEGESPREALHRELREELGVRPERYDVLGEKGGYRYEFPDGRTKFGKFRGQEQVYFLCAFHGVPSEVDIATPHPEFRAVQWIEPRAFQIDWVPPFKQAVYRQVFRDFFAVDL